MPKDLFCILHNPTGLFLDWNYEPHLLAEGITNWQLDDCPDVFCSAKDAIDAMAEAVGEIEQVGGISRLDHENSPCTAGDLQVMRLTLAPL